MSCTFVLSGVSSASRLNCHDPDVVDEAVRQLDRALACDSDPALAAWARRWGRQLADRALAAADQFGDGEDDQ